MAMNFLKILHRGGESSDGGGAGAASSRAAAASRKRVYTPSEVEATNQLRFLLAKMETLTLPEDRRATMEQLTQTVRDNPELVRHDTTWQDTRARLHRGRERMLIESSSMRDGLLLLPFSARRCCWCAHTAEPVSRHPVGSSVA